MCLNKCFIFCKILALRENKTKSPFSDQKRKRKWRVRFKKTGEQSDDMIDFILIILKLTDQSIIGQAIFIFRI